MKVQYLDRMAAAASEQNLTRALLERRNGYEQTSTRGQSPPTQHASKSPPAIPTSPAAINATQERRRRRRERWPEKQGGNDPTGTSPQSPPDPPGKRRPWTDRHRSAAASQPPASQFTGVATAPLPRDQRSGASRMVQKQQGKGRERAVGAAGVRRPALVPSLSATLFPPARGRPAVFASSCAAPAPARGSVRSSLSHQSQTPHSLRWLPLADRHQRLVNRGTVCIYCTLLLCSSPWLLHCETKTKLGC
jgi:hypothetical protein